MHHKEMKHGKRLFFQKGKKLLDAVGFTIKRFDDGTIERYKADLVATILLKLMGVDYFESFSSVAKIDTKRVLFSVFTNFD